jgi:hypothetical protein
MNKIVIERVIADIADGDVNSQISACLGTRGRGLLWKMGAFETVRFQNRRCVCGNLNSDKNKHARDKDIDQPRGVKRGATAFPDPWQNHVSLFVVSVSLKHHHGSGYRVILF